jgi:hypothetical protein
MVDDVVICLLRVLRLEVPADGFAWNSMVSVGCIGFFLFGFEDDGLP